MGKLSRNKGATREREIVKSRGEGEETDLNEPRAEDDYDGTMRQGIDRHNRGKP